MGRNKDRVELFNKTFLTRTDEEVDLLTSPILLQSAVDVALTELHFLGIRRIRNVNGLPLLEGADSLAVVFINVDGKKYSRLNDIGQYCDVSDEMLIDRVLFLSNQYELNPIQVTVNFYTHVGKAKKQDGNFRSNVQIINSLGRFFFSIKIQDLNPLTEEVTADA